MYCDDHRVRAANRTFRPDFDEKRMVLTVEVEECECPEHAEKSGYLPYYAAVADYSVGMAQGLSYGTAYVVVGPMEGCEGPSGRIVTASWQEASDLARVMLIEQGFDPDVSMAHTFEIPARFEVCGTCEGKGSHVNPSIDADGLSSDDFDEDPDFRERYFAGDYDTTCYGCRGSRVVPVPDEAACCTPVLKAALKAYEDRAEDDDDYDALCAAERRMGA